jgi:hypothetical protein
MVPGTGAKKSSRIFRTLVLDIFFATRAHPQLHPVVVPQSSHTSQCPLTFMRIDEQLEH